MLELPSDALTKSPRAPQRHPDAAVAARARRIEIFLLGWPGTGLAVPTAIAIVFIAAALHAAANERGVLTLFGDYVGTERTPGLRWVWPWIAAKKVSGGRATTTWTRSSERQARQSRGDRAVVVWRVADTRRRCSTSTTSSTS